MTPTDIASRADELYAELVGSCLDLPEEVIENQALADALDELTRCCESCDWWVDAEEIDDSSGEALCEDCRQDQED